MKERGHITRMRMRLREEDEMETLKETKNTEGRLTWRDEEER
jgi:translation initiation factor IF-1